MPSFPILEVKDVAKSSKWYQEVLGFKHVYTMDGPSGMAYLAHIRWMRYADVLLVQERTPIAGPKGAGITLCFNIFEGSIDEMANSFKAKGANVEGPIVQPWNAKEMTVIDSDGFKLRFTAPVDKTRDFDDVMDNIKKTME